MNNNRLLEIIKQNGDNCTSAASKLGITKVSFSHKMTGKTPWKLSELKKLRGIYGLSMREVEEIFF